MKIEWFFWGIALIIGFIAGGLYFSGLWFTVRRLALARKPGLLVIASFLVRMTIFMLGLILIAQRHWALIGPYLLGFFIMRAVYLKRYQPQNSDLSRVGNSHGTES